MCDPIWVPLDPEVAVVLDKMNALGNPPYEELPIAGARALAMTAFDDYVGPAPEVDRIVNRFVPGPTADLPVRIYWPKGVDPLGVLVYLHGSGWAIHNIDVTDVPVRALANATGCVVVAVNYQKAPEHKFPVPFDDAYAAVAWTASHLAELAKATSPLGVIGDSAGGNLAAAVCLRARDGEGPLIALQVLIYPATDYGWDTASAHENAVGYLLERSAVRWFWGQYLASESEAANPFVSPLRATSLAGLPPAFVVTAEFDPLRDEGELFAERLRQAGVPVKLHRYEGMTHAFFWMLGAVGQSRALMAEIGAEVRSAFGAS